MEVIIIIKRGVIAKYKVAYFKNQHIWTIKQSSVIIPLIFFNKIFTIFKKVGCEFYNKKDFSTKNSCTFLQAAH